MQANTVMARSYPLRRAFPPCWAGCACCKPRQKPAVDCRVFGVCRRSDDFPFADGFVFGSKRNVLCTNGAAPGVLMTVSLMAAGMLLAKFIDTFVPQNLGAPSADQGSKRLLRTGMVSMLGLAIHNLPEGIATFTAAYANAQMGISTAFAVAMHNIPEGISIALPIYYATKNRRRAIGMTVLSGLAEPLGAVLTMLFLQPLYHPPNAGGDICAGYWHYAVYCVC